MIFKIKKQRTGESYRLTLSLSCVGYSEEEADLFKQLFDGLNIEQGSCSCEKRAFNSFLDIKDYLGRYKKEKNHAEDTGTNNQSLYLAQASHPK